MENDVVILIYAKAPIPGEVKTRLQPALGTMGAAMLHSALVERAIETATRTDFDVVLCATPDDTHPFFAECEEDFGIGLATQIADENLGARMLASLTAALTDYQRVLLIGADCPAFTQKHLQEAAQQLHQHDVVLTPAEDGGYVLIGVRRVEPAMFDEIAWGTDSVLSQQLAALARTSLSHTEMATLWDVDRPEDLPRLVTLKPPLSYALNGQGA
jgi:uncharacterized protein